MRPGWLLNLVFLVCKRMQVADTRGKADYDEDIHRIK